MDHFAYRDGTLHAESVPLARIADAAGTPCYVYSRATLERHYRVLAEALAAVDPTICFAVKANGNLAVIRTLALLGAGADVVSGGELKLALAAGIPASRVVFSGVGKTRTEIAEALAAGVMQLNVESEPELEAVAAVAESMGRRAPVAIRVNPDVDALTHASISTGRGEHKFGIEWTAAHAVYGRAAAMPSLELVGLAMHIGSQVTDAAPFRAAFARMRDLVMMLRADGHVVRSVDLGGGLGIPYDDAAVTLAPADYAAIVNEGVGDLDCRVIIEPGRMLVANAGVLLSRVIYVKQGATRTFVIVDAAMNDLMRPALYGAHHAIVPVAEPGAGESRETVAVVGPVCETTDTFAENVALPPVASGDLLAFRTAGAYAAVMAGTYNARDLVGEAMVDGDAFAIVRRRLAVTELLGHQVIPEWLASAEEPPPIAAAGGAR